MENSKENFILCYRNLNGLVVKLNYVCTYRFEKISNEDLFRSEMQARRHGCYHHETTMEMARTCFEERTTFNHQNGTSLDARQNEKEKGREHHGEEQFRAR